jgi:hypothetical protein
MNNAKVDRLTRELLALYVRHGPDTFRQALESLRSGSALELLTATLEELELKAPRRRARTRPKAGAVAIVDRVDLLRDEILHSGVPDAPRVFEFSEGIAHGTFLREPRALRSYAAHMGMDVPKKMPPRQQIAREISRRLVKMNDVARRDFLELGERQDDSKSSLQGWSNLIVKR